MDINSSINDEINHIQQYFEVILKNQLNTSVLTEQVFNVICGICLEQIPHNATTLALYNDIINNKKWRHSDDKENVIINFSKVCVNDNRPVLYVLVGLPGSGKTTFKQNMLKNNYEYNCISRDDFIVTQYSHLIKDYNNFNDLYNKCWEMSVNDKDCNNNFNDHVTFVINQCKDTIIDMTNLSYNSRRRWINIAKKHNFKLVILWLNRNVNQCIAAQSNRDKQIHSTVIQNMANRFDVPLLGIECDEVFVINHVDNFKH